VPVDPTAKTLIPFILSLLTSVTNTWYKSAPLMYFSATLNLLFRQFSGSFSSCASVTSKFHPHFGSIFGPFMPTYSTASTIVSSPLPLSLTLSKASPKVVVSPLYFGVSTSPTLFGPSSKLSPISPSQSSPPSSLSLSAFFFSSMTYASLHTPTPSSFD
jgi:hypothetical protein